jgi:hypothetical protein
MDYPFLKTSLETDPAVRLLRSAQAPLVLSFLYAAFKENHLITVSHQDLVVRLAGFLERWGLSGEEDGPVLERADRLIDSWCGEQNRWLRKYMDDRGTAQHELTPALERAFRWMEDLRPREFVGTESRFQDILRRLRELVEGSGEDPEKRVAELKEKRAEIGREIQRIRRTGRVESYTAVQVRERFEEISRSARDLLADFRQVEQNFKELVREILREGSGSEADRGSVLGFTLDMVDELHSSPQGQSFDSFWQFLVADSGRDEINRLVDELFRLLAEKGMAAQDLFLRKLKFYLHQAGRKVVETNHLLAEKINRILAQSTVRERRRVRELIGEIRRLALRHVDRPPEEEDFLRVETEPELSMVMDRPLTTVQRETVFELPEEAGERLEEADLTLLFDRFFVDPRLLRTRVEAMLAGAGHGQVTLREVVERHPVEKGLAEIVAYLSLASTMERAMISENDTDPLLYRRNGKEVRVEMPRVIWLR